MPGVQTGDYGWQHKRDRNSRRLGVNRTALLRRFIPVRWATLALCSALTGVASAGSGLLSPMPDAIVCSVKDPTGVLPWEKLVFYVSARMNDGQTLYKTLTSDPVVLLVNADGVVSGGNLADCDGRRIGILREQGQAFDLGAVAEAVPK